MIDTKALFQLNCREDILISFGFYLGIAGRSVMEETLLKVISKNDKPAENFSLPDTGFEIHSGSNLDILITYKPIDVCSDEHTHEGYEFFVPYSDSPSLETLSVEGVKVTPHPGSLIPTNPGQSHGADGDFTINSSLCLYIPRKHLVNFAYSAAGVKDLFFYNKANSYNQNLQHLINLFVQESQNKQVGYKHLLESLSTQIIIELLRSTGNNALGKMKRREVGTNLSILKVVEYLHDNYDQDFTNEELLNIANLSPYYFIRLFKKETGRTPQKYLVELKIDKAKELLSLSDYSVTEICFLCGFSEHSHFSKVFKKLTGSTPLRYRKNHRDKLH